MELNKKKWIEKENALFSGLPHFSPSQQHYVDMSNIASHPAIPACHHHVLLLHFYTTTFYQHPLISQPATSYLSMV